MTTDWQPDPFQHTVSIELWADLHGTEAWFTMSEIPVDDADGATEYLRAKILALQTRLTPPKKPRKPRKRRAGNCPPCNGEL